MMHILLHYYFYKIVLATFSSLFPYRLYLDIVEEKHQMLSFPKFASKATCFLIPTCLVVKLGSSYNILSAGSKEDAPSPKSHPIIDKPKFLLHRAKRFRIYEDIPYEEQSPVSFSPKSIISFFLLNSLHQSPNLSI